MNTALQNELSQLRELVAGLRGTLAEVKIENQLLRQKLEFFIKRYFGGTKNESLDPKQLAAKAGLDEQRTLAIVMGRWTPSPAERDQIAAVFGLTRDQIVWGHTTPIQHISCQAAPAKQNE